MVAVHDDVDALGEPRQPHDAEQLREQEDLLAGLLTQWEVLLLLGLLAGQRRRDRDSGRAPRRVRVRRGRAAAPAASSVSRAL